MSVSVQLANMFSSSWLSIEAHVADPFPALPPPPPNCQRANVALRFSCLEAPLTVPPSSSWCSPTQLSGCSTIIHRTCLVVVLCILVIRLQFHSHISALQSSSGIPLSNLSNIFYAILLSAQISLFNLFILFWANKKICNVFAQYSSTYFEYSLQVFNHHLCKQSPNVLYTRNIWKIIKITHRKSYIIVFSVLDILFLFVYVINKYWA